MSNATNFINEVSKFAVEVGNKYNLYPSVMIAQACLESGYGNSQLSDPPNHNLFGIKGTYNGNSVTLRTAEQDKNGSVYYVNAPFRKYPSYRESFEDNAKLLREGLSWDRSFYKGTWRENTKLYREATAWLKGRYATDIHYDTKLNNIIESHNLTRFDGKVTDTITKTEIGVVNMNGTFTCTEQILVRDKPSTSGNHIATYLKGEKVRFEKVHFVNGYVWLQYKRNNGGYGYLPIAPLNEVWGKFS